MKEENILIWIPRFLSVFLTLVVFAFLFDFTPKELQYANFFVAIIPGVVMLAVALVSWLNSKAGGISLILISIIYAVLVWGKVSYWAIAGLSISSLVIGILHLVFDRRSEQDKFKKMRDRIELTEAPEQKKEEKVEEVKIPKAPEEKFLEEKSNVVQSPELPAEELVEKSSPVTNAEDAAAETNEPETKKVEKKDVEVISVEEKERKEDLPQWIKDLKKNEDPEAKDRNQEPEKLIAEEFTDPKVQPAEKDTPDWLSELEKSTQDNINQSDASKKTIQKDVTETQIEEIPDWLEDISSIDTAPIPEENKKEMKTPESREKKAKLPDWLDEMIGKEKLNTEEKKTPEIPTPPQPVREEVDSTEKQEEKPALPTLSLGGKTIDTSKAPTLNEPPKKFTDWIVDSNDKQE